MIYVADKDLKVIKTKLSNDMESITDWFDENGLIITIKISCYWNKQYLKSEYQLWEMLQTSITQITIIDKDKGLSWSDLCKGNVGLYDSSNLQPAETQVDFNSSKETHVISRLLFESNQRKPKKTKLQFNLLPMPNGPGHVNWCVNVMIMIFVRAFKGIFSYSSTRHKLKTANVW